MRTDTIKTTNDKQLNIISTAKSNNRYYKILYTMITAATRTTNDKQMHIIINIMGQKCK